MVSGTFHNITGSWCEWNAAGSASGKTFLSVSGTGVVGVFAAGNRVLGPAYYQLSGGALRSQLQILEPQVNDGPFSAGGTATVTTGGVMTLVVAPTLGYISLGQSVTMATLPTVAYITSLLSGTINVAGSTYQLSQAPSVAITVAAALTSQQGPNLNPTMNIARVQVKNSTTQSVAHNTPTVLTFNTENFNTDAMHSTITNPSRITFNTAGTYQVSASASFPLATATAGVFARLYIQKGGSPLRYCTQNTVSASNDTIISFTTTLNVAAGEYIEVVAYHNAGSPVLVAAGESTVFEAAWLGS